MDATVRPTTNPGLYSIRYNNPLPGKTAIIIPTKNHHEILEIAVDSLTRTVPKELYDLVVVNHESDDPNTVAYLHEIAKVHRVVDYQGVFNFSKINNFAVTQLDEAYDSFLFMNNDVQAINAGWFESMRDKLGRKEVGIVGAILLYPPDSKAKGVGVIEDAEAFDPSEPLSDLVGSHSETQEVTLLADIPKCKIQHAGVHLGVGVAEHYLKFERYQNSHLEGPGLNPAVPELATRSFSAVTAACMMTRADIFKKLSGFDEELAVGFQDVDLCLRAGNEGYKVLCDAEAVLFHHESVSRNTDDFLERDPHPQDTSNFRSKYEHDIGRDPFYHPMLAYTTPQYRPLRSIQQGQFLSGRVVTNLALQPYRTRSD
jgi:GT2 family glycosyltransferase